MKLVVFEDESWVHFTPLVYTRPVFALRCGAFTALERLKIVAQTLTRHHPLPINAICRPYLMSCYGHPEGAGAFLRDSEPLVLVNGRAMTLEWLPDLLDAPTGTVYATPQGELLGAHLSPSLASAVLYYISEQNAQDALEELHRFARVQEVETTLLNYLWDLIAQSGEQVVRDLPLLQPRIPRWEPQHAFITLRGGEHIYVAPTAELDGPLVLDSRDGPIFIDERAHIEPFSFIQGPAYIGQGTLISSALIRGETSIGPVCRIGGEVEASIIQAYTNKHHEGFLGHSWLGEWVNIGAMTTNSDLKNTYGNIRVTIDGVGTLDSGELKLGAFLADHVKLGIGMHLTGGSIIGVGSSIYGIHMIPKNVPPFTWGGEVFHEYRIESMINVSQKVMSRRKLVMSPEYETMLRAVFAITRENRNGLQGVLPTSQPTKPDVEKGLLSFPVLKQ
jgi:UDP-N-acetylglucosamine diphosphorylase/glucosamine-1-phosphate N-acetyltransferase